MDGSVKKNLWCIIFCGIVKQTCIFKRTEVMISDKEN